MRKRLVILIVAAISVCGISATDVVSKDYAVPVTQQSASVPSKQQVRALLEHWCIEYYNTCFRNRTYIKNSLTVTSLKEDESTGFLKVRGKHSFIGPPLRLGGQKPYPDVDFRATIMPSGDGANVTVRFEKWKVPYFSWQEGGWEMAERTVYLNR